MDRPEREIYSLGPGKLCVCVLVRVRPMQSVTQLENTPSGRERKARVAPGTRKPALKTLVIQTTLALFTTDNDQYYN